MDVHPSSRKEAYKKFCLRKPELPLFLQYDWINGITAQEEWDVCIAGDLEDPKGIFVYSLKHKLGFRRAIHPPLTPFLGPWINYPKGQKRASRHGYEKKVLEELIDGLPPFDELIMNFHPSVKNWLPFYWKGYEQSTRYTYKLHHPLNMDEIFSGFRDNLRWDIRKAEKSLKIQASQDIEALYRIKRKDHEKNGTPLDHGKSHLERIDRILRPTGNALLLFAVDTQGKKIAGGYFAMDRYTSYYLIGGTDPDSKKSGAMPLLIHKAIQDAADRSLSFDLEGSMVPGVEHFFRGFGAERIPYHRVWKTESLFLRLRKGGRKLLNRN